MIICCLVAFVCFFDAAIGESALALRRDGPEPADAFSARRAQDFDSAEFQFDDDRFDVDVARPQFDDDEFLAIFGAYLGLICCCLSSILIIGLAIQAAICWHMAGCLAAVPVQYRKMEPGMIWLLMIPLFSLVWLYFVVISMSQSFENFFLAMGRTDRGDCGRGMGIAVAICISTTIIPYLGLVTGIAGLVMMIVYLAQLQALKTDVLQRGTVPPR